MLKGLKEKLLDYTKTVGLFHPQQQPQSKPQKSATNLNAGAELLTHFQHQWVELHELAEGNARRAAEVARMIPDLKSRALRDRECLSRMTKLVGSIASAVEGADGCYEQICGVQESFERIEEGLIELEDVIERLELQEVKARHYEQLKSYERIKKVGLEAKKEDLLEKVKKLQSESESHENRILQERQEVFQEAFKADLETYKVLGTIPKIETIHNSGALLEEIQIDYDEKELDQFLKE